MRVAMSVSLCSGIDINSKSYSMPTPNSPLAFWNWFRLFACNAKYLKDSHQYMTKQQTCAIYTEERFVDSHSHRLLLFLPFDFFRYYCRSQTETLHIKCIRMCSARENEKMQNLLGPSTLSEDSSLHALITILEFLIIIACVITLFSSHFLVHFLLCHLNVL